MTTVAAGDLKTNALSGVLMACSTVADGSGMMAAVAPLAGQLGRLGFDVRLVGPFGLGDQPAVGDQTAGVRVDVTLRESIYPPLTDAWNAAAAVAEFARDGRRRVVHVHGVWTAANAAACLRARVLGVPYIVSPHGMLLPAAMQRSSHRKRWALGAFVRRNLETAAVVHASSEAERASVLAVAPAARTTVIPWGVDIPDAPLGRRPDGRRRQAAYLGRIMPLKGVDELLAAWDDVRPPGWELRFIGADPDGYARRLADAIDSRRLRDTVSIQPPIGRAALLGCIQQLDLVVLPSHSENFGMVVAESLAVGVPVITTTATPWQDVVQRQCGWWVPDTRAGLAEAIRLASEMPADDLAAMGTRGRSWMADCFAWPVIAARFTDQLYDACP